MKKIEIPEIRTLGREAEAKLIYELWHIPGSGFGLAVDADSPGKNPLYYEAWISSEYLGVAIVLISIDTRSQAYRGSWDYVDEGFKGQAYRDELAYTGTAYFKVICRYLIEIERHGEGMWSDLFSAASRRFLTDVFDPELGVGRLTIGG